MQPLSRPQLAEYLGEIDIQLRPFDLKPRGLYPFRAGTHTAAGRLGVEDSNRLHAHRAVVLLRPLLRVGVAIVGRPNLDHQQRRIGQYIGLRSGCEHYQIRHANPAL